MKKEYHFLSALERYFMNYFKNLIEKESAQFNLWLPIVFAFGIVAYFYLPFEAQFIFPLSAFILSVLAFIWTKNKSCIAFVFLIFLFFFAGFCRISYETNRLNTPFIQKPYDFIQITGTVEKLDYRPNGYRLTLNNLRTTKIPENERPIKVRISVNGSDNIPNVGDKIYVKANLNPPSSAFYPNGYNFARQAYFEQIGAIGFSVGNLQILEKHSHNHPMEKIRSQISHKILTLLPNDSGAIITALITGDQGAISKETRNSYASAGIVHVLSVSGFHMSLIAFFIFAFVRLIFSLIPVISLRYNTKKICALIALISTFAYLLISGMAIPAIRSFLMISFVLFAVIADRQALSVRSLSWAGFLILLIWPYELMSAGFALSFSACYGLIFAYEVFFKLLNTFFKNKSIWIKYPFKIGLFFLLTNLLIYCVISPIVIYHFNRLNNYAVLGNFCTSALFSFFIMPLLFFAVILMPFGLENSLLLISAFLIDKITLLCEWISKLPYATVFLPPLSDIGYAVFLFGILWICCWKSKIRYFGLIMVVFGVFSVFNHKIPNIIVSENSKNIAIYKNDSFIINQVNRITDSWFERNGFPVPENPNFINIQKSVYYQNLHIDFTGMANGKFDLIINNHQPCQANILCISHTDLKQKGTHIIYIDKKNLQIQTQKDLNRPWSKKN